MYSRCRTHVQKFGDVDMSSGKNMFMSLGHSTAAKHAPLIPPAFKRTTDFAPPTMCVVSVCVGICVCVCVYAVSFDVPSPGTVTCMCTHCMYVCMYAIFLGCRAAARTHLHLYTARVFHNSVLYAALTSVQVV